MNASLTPSSSSSVPAFQLARNPHGRLVLTLADGTAHEGVTPVRAFPIAAPGEGLEGIVEMCNARYGWNKTVDDYLEMGKQLLREERSFNKKAGIAEGSDDLPDFFRNEKLPPHNTVFDIPKEDLNKVFNF